MVVALEVPAEMVEVGELHQLLELEEPMVVLVQEEIVKAAAVAEEEEPAVQVLLEELLLLDIIELFLYKVLLC
jgi:hypothetical protein